MKPSQLSRYLKFAIENKISVLVKGKPGIGKSDIIEEVTSDIDADLILEHPVVSDPTDYKGLPFAVNGEAMFLPFKNLKKMINATKPTVCFVDDLGQAPASVQSAFMQILLARRIGEHRVSDHVTFIAATNRKEDKAGVTGVLEPVKSRFRAGIIDLEVDANDWILWALDKGNMPLELISFIRFKPDIINEFKPTKDIVNYASPRTVASVGMVQNYGVPQDLEHEAFKGIAGEAFAAEYSAFLRLMRELPSLDEIIQNPTSARLPQGAGQTFALCAGLANRASEVNLESIITYTNRLKPEFSVSCITDATRRKPELRETRAYTRWSIEKQQVLNI